MAFGHFRFLRHSPDSTLLHLAYVLHVPSQSPSRRLLCNNFYFNFSKKLLFSAPEFHSRNDFKGRSRVVIGVHGSQLSYLDSVGRRLLLYENSNFCCSGIDELAFAHCNFGR